VTFEGEVHLVNAISLSQRTKGSFSTGGAAAEENAVSRIHGEEL
jgi:hypothetical protein